MSCHRVEFDLHALAMISPVRAAYAGRPIAWNCSRPPQQLPVGIEPSSGADLEQILFSSWRTRYWRCCSARQARVALSSVAKVRLARIHTVASVRCLRDGVGVTLDLG